MTVDAQVKNCYFSIRQADATLQQLAIKTSSAEAKQAFQTALPLLSLVQQDLESQLIYIAKEEPQYE